MWYTLDCLAAARTGFIHSDHLGSTSLTTDITGTVVAETRYLPYGEERWTTGTLVTDFTFIPLRGIGWHPPGGPVSAPSGALEGLPRHFLNR
jgi:hypothetical protein